jgi:hypothetical protein
MTSASVVLLSNASATGTAVQWPGGRGQFACIGTFGGTSVQLQYMGPNGSYISVQAMDSSGVLTAVPVTAAGGFVFELPPCYIKAVVTGGSPSAMYATAARV